MTIQTTLPRVNELGYYEMRLESIGGLGANLCGKLRASWARCSWA